MGWIREEFDKLKEERMSGTENESSTDPAAPAVSFDPTPSDPAVDPAVDAAAPAAAVVPEPPEPSEPAAPSSSIVASSFDYELHDGWAWQPALVVGGTPDALELIYAVRAEDGSVYWKAATAAEGDGEGDYRSV